MNTAKILTYSAIAVSLAVAVSTLLSNTNAFAFSWGNWGGSSNSISQALTQSQSITQDSSASSTGAGNIATSANNIGINFQTNSGNLTQSLH